MSHYEEKGFSLQVTGFSNKDPMPVTSTHRGFTLSENRCSGSLLLAGIEIKSLSTEQPLKQPL
jgi:hypothetical protein